MESYVYRKEVDWSVFTDGFAIPLSLQVVFRRNTESFLRPGETKPIWLYLDGQSYQAVLKNLPTNAKAPGRSERVQVRYGENSPVALALRTVFYASYHFLKEERKSRLLGHEGKRIRLRLPEECREYLVIYTTEYADSLSLEAIGAKEMTDLRETIKGKAEQLVEAELDFPDRDAGAGLSAHEGLIKVRKLNRLIGENLKLLYGYRCQICGEEAGADYGCHVAEAHHLDYFVKSLNNDANNQVIVCPTHHRIIHAVNPIFDRRRRLFLYENGKEEPLRLNRHL